MRELLTLAHQRGVFVEWSRNMGEHLRGVYEHHARTITLNSLMSVVQQRYTLAHELGHAWHEHTFTGDPHADLEAERLADEHAAGLLIAPHAYARAEELCGPHPGAIGDELGVHASVVATFQRVLRRTTPSAYMHPWGHAPWASLNDRSA